MSFHWPYALFALPLALAGVLVLFKTSARAREQLLGKFAAQRLLPLLLANYSPVLRRLKQTVLAVGVVLTVLALARPQWGYAWQERQGRGVDVIFVIDTSKSMLAQDVQPSRLERAKLAILDSAEKMGGNRIGLVAFAGDAFLMCPLTLDYDAFRQTLEAVDVNTIARSGTDIASGLDEAATALESSGNHKIIVLLTDGEDLEGEGVNEAKALAQQNVTVYTIGVGTPEGEIIPIRDAKGGTDFVRDQRGEIVKSHLDAATLTSIAEATHGFYQPLGATGEGLIKVYEEGIKKIPQQDLTSQMQREPIERFQWPLGIGTLLLAIELLIGTRRPSWRRNAVTTVNLREPLPVSAARSNSGNKAPSPKPPVIAAVSLLVLILSANTSTHAADSPPVAPVSAADTATSAPPIQSADAGAPAASAASGNATAPVEQYSAKQAQSLFQKGDYLGAAEAYGQAAEANPQDGRFRYNQGESLYRGGNFDGAADAFAKTLSSNDLLLQQRAYYNLGNTHYRLGQADMQQDQKKAQSSWEQAVKDYQNALELNPNDADAKYNLGVVKQQIEELKKQMEQQKQQQNQQDKDNKDNQQQNQPQNQQPNQSQQNPSPQNQSPQNQSGQQNNSPQNQPQNGQNQPQNQSGQQNSSSGDNNQNPQNSSGSPNQPQNQSGQQNPGNQPSPDQSNQNGGQKPRDRQNQSGQNPRPGDQNKPNSQSGQKPGDKDKNGPQKQAAGQAGGNQSGKEPDQKSGGQNQTAAAAGGAAAASASTNPDDQAANGAVIVGGMTREEARQLLDSLKTGERKLPASQLQSQNAKPPPDQYYKDW